MELPLGVVVNLSAGTPKIRSIQDRIKLLLGRDGNAPQVHFASTGTELLSASKLLIEQGYKVLVGAGGDGTLSALASLLVDTNVTLGVLPLGTRNHFARDLGIPSDLETACKVILSGRVAHVDVGKLNDRFFVNNSSLGLYPSIVRRRELWEKTGATRMLAFAAAIIFALRRYPFLDVRVHVDGNDLVRRSPFVFVGNNQYEVEGLQLGRRASLNSGALALYTANRAGRIGLLRISLSALFHRLKRIRDFEVLLARELLIETRRKRVRVALDGELFHMAPPLHYSVKPGALRVIVPD